MQVAGNISLPLQSLGQTGQPIVNTIPLSGSNIGVGSMPFPNYASSSIPLANSIASIWTNPSQPPSGMGGHFYTGGNQLFTLQYNMPYGQQPYIPTPPPIGIFYQSPTYPPGNTLMGRPYGPNIQPILP